MNYALFFMVVSVLFIGACQSAPADTTQVTLPSTSTLLVDDHIGCQEGEIDQDGNCIPAPQANVAMFSEGGLYDIVSFSVESPLGYVARPVQEGNYPGVVMIHEWWGLNDNIKMMADTLASYGYIVFAVDLYGGVVAEDSSVARVQATAVRNNPDGAVDHMRMAVRYLNEQGAERIASLGWCFGGQQSLQLSLSEDIDATIIYYGNLVEDPEQLRSISGPVLGIFGAEDTGIPVSSVRNFESSLNALDVANQIHVYEGVGHAFANPSGSNYAPDATRDAWEKTIAFLAESLQ